MVNKNVNLASGLNIMQLNKPAEMRAAATVGCSFKLPKTKTEFQYLPNSDDNGF